MRKIKNSDIKSTNLQSVLIIFLVTALIWLSDFSVFDSIYLPRIVAFSVFTLILMIVSFNRIQNQFRSHPLLIILLSVLTLTVCLGIPFMENFYGESQRINGTLMLVLISTSILIGLISQDKGSKRAMTKTLIINGALVSILVIVAHYMTAQTSLLRSWTAGNLEGGINENFKSMFIAVSLSLHLSLLKRNRRVLNKQYWIICSIFVHGVALILIGSLQGILLVVLTVIFIACVSKSNLRFGVPFLSFIYIATYLSFLFLSPLGKMVDSSTLERIYLARRAIEILKNAPLFIPNPLRISENDFSDATLTKIPGTTFWVDDVHNVFLNIGNTYGIVWLLIIVISITWFVFDFYKNALQLSWESKVIGAIILSTSLVLCITIYNPIYFLPFCFVVGMYAALRNRALKSSKRSIPPIQTEKRDIFKVKESKIGMVVIGILILQLTYGTFAILKEYLNQKEVNRIVVAQPFAGNNKTLGSFTELELILESSHDLRFIYEVGRSYYREGDCESTNKIANILRDRSSSHFLTKKLDSLYSECLGR